MDSSKKNYKISIFFIEFRQPKRILFFGSHMNSVSFEQWTKIFDLLIENSLFIKISLEMHSCIVRRMALRDSCTLGLYKWILFEFSKFFQGLKNNFSLRGISSTNTSRYDQQQTKSPKGKFGTAPHRERKPSIHGVSPANHGWLALEPTLVDIWVRQLRTDAKNTHRQVKFFHSRTIPPKQKKPQKNLWLTYFFEQIGHFFRKNPTFMVGSRLGSKRHSKCAVECSFTSSRLRSVVTKCGGPYWISVSWVGTSGWCSNRWIPGRLSGCRVPVSRAECPEHRTLALVTSWPYLFVARTMYTPESSSVTWFKSNATNPKSCVSFARLAALPGEKNGRKKWKHQ